MQPEEKRRDIPALATDPIDQQGAADRSDHAAGGGDEAVGQAGLQRQLEEITVQRRQPCDQAVDHQIGAEPDHPGGEGSDTIDALEQLPPIGITLRDPGNFDRFGCSERFAFLYGGAFEVADDPVGLLQASLRRQPTRRFCQQQAQRNHQDGRQQADQKHRPPAVERHQKIAGHAGKHQADRKNHLVKQEEPTASLGADEFVDIGARNRDLAAGADSLNKAESAHRKSVPGKQAGDVHADKQDDRQQQHLEAPDTLSQPTEKHCTHQLPEISERKDHADLGRRQLPLPGKHRHREGDGEHRIGIEECRGANDDADAGQFSGNRQSFDARADILRGQRARAWLDVSNTNSSGLDFFAFLFDRRGEGQGLKPMLPPASSALAMSRAAACADLSARFRNSSAEILAAGAAMLMAPTARPSGSSTGTPRMRSPSLSVESRSA